MGTYETTQRLVDTKLSFIKKINMEIKEAGTLVGIKQIFVDMGVHETEITLDAHLLKDLGLDSLDLADLIMKIEEAYNIKVDYQDTDGLVCVADVVNYVELKLNGY